MNLKLLNMAYNGFGVKRFHTVAHVITPETVGHHTAGVIAILFCIYDQKPPMSIIQEALYHDIPEVITGDIPATAKWDFPRLNGAIEAAEAEIIKAFDNPTGADQMDRDIVRFADLLQLTVKAHEEVECGNIKMFDIRHNGIEACLKLLHEKLPNFTNAHNLFELLLKDWQNESD